MTSLGAGGGQVVEYSRLVPEPWANGAGTTRVLGVGGWMEGGPFSWRLSLADLALEAPFSRFPGIDRILTLASAGPLDLSVDGVRRSLSRGQQACFPGESAAAASPSGAPQLALNLMVRRKDCAGAVEVRTLHRPLTLEPGSGVVAAVILAGQAEVAKGRVLGPGAAVIPGPDQVRLVRASAMIAVVTARRRHR